MISARDSGNAASAARFMRQHQRIRFLAGAQRLQHLVQLLQLPGQWDPDLRIAEIAIGLSQAVDGAIGRLLRGLRGRRTAPRGCWRTGPVRERYKHGSR